MGVTQAVLLAEWLNRTQGNARWIITRGCSMHTGSAVTSALQMSLDDIMFASGLLSHTRVPMWDLPISSPDLACFEHGVVIPSYADFPPIRSRPFLTQRLNLLIGYSPGPPSPCAAGIPGPAAVGVYYRSGTADVRRLRRMCNFDAALAGLGELVGPAAVAAFTTNDALSLRAQIEAFDRFDVLLGPHGSHWAISWFAERPRAVIEVQPVLGAFDLRRAVQTKGPRHQFYVSAGHEFYANDCGGPEPALAERARQLCAPHNFDGTSLLCDDVGGVGECAGVPRCRPRRPEDQPQLLRFKYQSLRANVTALRLHVAAVVALLCAAPPPPPPH